MAYYTKITDIEERFIQEGLPQWELYNGRVKTRPVPEKKNNRLDYYVGGDIDEAYHRLERTLDRISGRQGNVMLFLGPIEETPKFSMPIALSRQTMTNNLPSAVNGTQPNGGGVRGYESALEDRMKIYDLEKTVQEIQGANQGKFWDRVGDAFIEKVDPNTLVTLATHVIGKILGNPVQQTPVINNVEKNVENTEVGSNVGDDANMEHSINRLIENLQNNFDNEQEIVGFLNKINNTIVQNPEILKQIAG